MEKCEYCEKLAERTAYIGDDIEFPASVPICENCYEEIVESNY